MSEVFDNRFPTYNVLDKWDTPSWNEQTRAVIHKRLHQVPDRRFFTEAEWGVLWAVSNRLVPQPDRREDPVPIVPFIDEKLFKGQGNGYRYDGMPPMREAWRRGIQAIDDEARARWGGGFRELPINQQDAVLRAIQHNDVRSASWRGLPQSFFSRACCYGKWRASITRILPPGARSALAGLPRHAAMSASGLAGAIPGRR